MTALEQYDRLESGGLWRSEPEAQRRDVVVSFGNATLVVADSAGRPLTHWSLPAVVRLNEGERPAVFAPEADADETLEIDDDIMIDAIEKIRKTLLKSRPHPKRLRHLITIGMVTAVLGLAVFWFPGAVRKQAVAVVPASKRAEMGATILDHLQSTLGNRCTSARGDRALTDLNRRLFGQASGSQILVLPRGLGTAIALPGDLILLDQDRVETPEDPAVTAGYVLAAHARRLDQDPLAPVIEAAGVQATLRLLTTGDIPPEHLRSYADTFLGKPAQHAKPETVQQVFELASVAPMPYISDLENIDQDIEFDMENFGSIQTKPILTDGAWISLQGICDH